MGTERSDQVYQYWKESSERFDYFIAGLTGALTAYVGQGLSPVEVGINPNTVELISVLFLVMSMYFGLKRIEKTVLIFMLQHQRVYGEETRGTIISLAQKGQIINISTGSILNPSQIAVEAEKQRLIVEAAQKRIDEENRVNLLYYKKRNITLLIGFALLIISRIMPAYMKYICTFTG